MKPIDNVIADHAPALLAIAGVAGVYEEHLEDGSVRIRVAVVARSAAVVAAIPPELDGYPVVIVETGPIGPLR
jgi:hypothetical protein